MRKHFSYESMLRRDPRLEALRAYCSLFHIFTFALAFAYAVWRKLPETQLILLMLGVAALWGIHQLQVNYALSKEPLRTLVEQCKLGKAATLFGGKASLTLKLCIYTLLEGAGKHGLSHYTCENLTMAKRDRPELTKGWCVYQHQNYPDTSKVHSYLFFAGRGTHDWRGGALVQSGGSTLWAVQLKDTEDRALLIEHGGHEVSPVDMEEDVARALHILATWRNVGDFAAALQRECMAYLNTIELDENTRGDIIRITHEYLSQVMTGRTRRLVDRSPRETALYALRVTQCTELERKLFEAHPAA